MGVIGGIAGAAGLMTPRTLVVPIAVANTEQPITFPDGTGFFRIHNGGNYVLKLSYQPGESATNYIPVYPADEHAVSGIIAPSITIYVQSPGLINLHIETWT